MTNDTFKFYNIIFYECIIGVLVDFWQMIFFFMIFYFINVLIVMFLAPHFVLHYLGQKFEKLGLRNPKMQEVR